jgi:hypothetical protein
MIALALIMPNIGALYRMRDAFWILLVIVGAEGAVQTRTWWSSRKSSKVVEEVLRVRSILVAQATPLSLNIVSQPENHLARATFPTRRNGRRKW